MSHDISSFGVSVVLRASRTLPTGVILTQFADDADGIDKPSVQIGDAAMGINGDMVAWSKANPLAMTLNLIPGSANDVIVGQVFQANRAGKGKVPARDIITVVVTWPNGQIETWSGGMFTDGMPGNSAASSGRMKTKAYALKFENYTSQP